MIRALALAFLLCAAAPAVAANIEAVPVTVLPTPDFDRTASPSPSKEASRLTLVSSKANQITDEEAWLERNGLEIPHFDLGNLPALLPQRFRGLPLQDALYGKGLTLLLYGRDGAGSRYLVAMEDKTETFPWAFDFASFLEPPGRPADEFTEQRVIWAAVEGGVLYVSNGHRTYATSSAGRNAYLTAIDLATGKILWRSRPLVSNANNFLVLDAGIVTGYGFTKEPDFLFLLDKKTGEVISQVKVKSGPELILEREGILYVRCYDTDYVFKAQK